MGATDDQPKPPIRVLLVDDSALARTIIARVLSKTPEIRVVATAAHGREALEAIPRVRPDVICTDLRMPVMDGLELIRAVMVHHPCPILVLSVSVQHDQTEHIFEVLEAGAVDVMIKPRAGLSGEDDLEAEELIRKIRILAGVRVFRRQASEPRTTPPRIPTLSENRIPAMIAIGASTGGPQAFRDILAQLPADFPAPIVCVQHISPGFMQGLVDWLAGQCRIPVQSARSGLLPQAGYAYFPADGAHLLLDDRGRFACTDDPPCCGHRPSINLTFQSLARRYSAGVAGILLTGMGSDGVSGLKAIADAGGVTIAQDETSSVIFGMPREAIAAQAARYVMPLSGMAPALVQWLTGKGHVPDTPHRM